MVKSKRIQLLANLCQGYDTVLDIGTDHGLVLLEAFQKKYIRQAIASDLRPLPLKQAKRNLKNYPAKFVLSDGFLAVNEPFDLVMISGMGAYLIADILKNAPLGEMDFILQPNDKPEDLRKFIMENQFMITDEFAVFDKHFYIIMKVKRGIEHLDDEDVILGHKLKHKPSSIPYYAYKIGQIDKIISKVNLKRKEELLYIQKIYKDQINKITQMSDCF